MVAGAFFGETANSAAVLNHFPVHLLGAHFVFKAGDISRAHRRVIGAVKDENLALDIILQLNFDLGDFFVRAFSLSDLSSSQSTATSWAETACERVRRELRRPDPQKAPDQ